MEGRKDDTGKLPWDLLDYGAVEDVVRVLAFGAAKYAPYNWAKGMAWSRLQAATMRHLTAWWRGEDTDPETGLPHLAHAACCIMFLQAYGQRGLGEDDRPISDAMRSLDAIRSDLAKVDALKPKEGPPLIQTDLDSEIVRRQVEVANVQARAQCRSLTGQEAALCAAYAGCPFAPANEDPSGDYLLPEGGEWPTWAKDGTYVRVLRPEGWVRVGRISAGTFQPIAGPAWKRELTPVEERMKATQDQLRTQAQRETAIPTDWIMLDGDHYPTWAPEGTRVFHRHPNGKLEKIGVIRGGAYHADTPEAPSTPPGPEDGPNRPGRPTHDEWGNEILNWILSKGSVRREGDHDVIGVTGNLVANVLRFLEINPQHDPRPRPPVATVFADLTWEEKDVLCGLLKAEGWAAPEVTLYRRRHDGAYRADTPAEPAKSTLAKNLLRLDEAQARAIHAAVVEKRDPIVELTTQQMTGVARALGMTVVDPMD